MNALTMPSHHSTLRTLLALVRKEIWQHRIGFVWAPLIVAAVFLLMQILMIVTGHIKGVQVNGFSLMTEGALKLAATNTPPADLARGIAVGMFGVCSIFHSIFFVVSVAYCLGTLYDERKDRSILFWKSLPGSDVSTVMSKIIMLLVVGPAMMLVGMLAFLLGTTLLFAVTIWWHGGDAMALVFAPAAPFSTVARYAVLHVVHGFWMLPLYGWLLLCSAWAVNMRPFLWATLVPALFATLSSWFEILTKLSFDLSWQQWKVLLSRLTAGIVPVTPGQHLGHWDKMKDLGLPPMSSYLSPFAGSDLWIGAFAGACMIWLCVELRRRRDDNAA
jgi:ABC-2 type transport system permease protein